MSDEKKLIKSLALPVILLIALVVFFALYKFLHLPTSDELVVIIRSYFEKYGYPVLFISAFIEGIPPIYLYFPGSSVILLAAAFSRQGTMNLVAVILVAFAAAMAAFSLDYFIGYHGYYRILRRFGFAEPLKSAGRKIESGQNKWLFLTYFHPNFGALTATAFGILKVPYRKFLMSAVPAVLFWWTFWAVICYLSSEKIAALIAARWFVIFLVLIWIGVKVVQIFRARAKAKTKEAGSRPA